MDFARLLSRICSVVNPPPQTLQRQPGDAACAIPGTGCRSVRARTRSLPTCGHGLALSDLYLPLDSAGCGYQYC